MVDNERRLVGILTVDDALGILEEADSEDQARISGSENPPALPHDQYRDPGSLAVVGCWCWQSSGVDRPGARRLRATLAEVVTLAALFVPLLIGTGGNTGNQAATTVTGRWPAGCHARDIAKVLGREFRVGLSLGLILGSVGFVPYQRDLRSFDRFGHRSDPAQRLHHGGNRRRGNAVAGQSRSRRPGGVLQPLHHYIRRCDRSGDLILIAKAILHI